MATASRPVPSQLVLSDGMSYCGSTYCHWVRSDVLCVDTYYWWDTQIVASLHWWDTQIVPSPSGLCTDSNDSLGLLCKESRMWQTNSCILDGGRVGVAVYLASLGFALYFPFLTWYSKGCLSDSLVINLVISSLSHPLSENLWNSVMLNG